MEHRMALAVAASAAMLLTTSGIAVAVVGDVPILGFGNDQPPVTVTVAVAPVVVTEVITMDHVVVIPGSAPAIAIATDPMPGMAVAEPVTTPGAPVAVVAPEVAAGSAVANAVPGAAVGGQPAAAPPAAAPSAATATATATVAGPPATVPAAPANTVAVPVTTAAADPIGDLSGEVDGSTPPAPADCANPVYMDGFWECEG